MFEDNVTEALASLRKVSTPSMYCDACGMFGSDHCRGVMVDHILVLLSVHLQTPRSQSSLEAKIARAREARRQEASSSIPCSTSWHVT